jgi:hypothetical protein
MPQALNLRPPLCISGGLNCRCPDGTGKKATAELRLRPSLPFNARNHFGLDSDKDAQFVVKRIGKWVRKRRQQNPGFGTGLRMPCSAMAGNNRLAGARGGDAWERLHCSSAGGLKMTSNIALLPSTTARPPPPPGNEKPKPPPSSRRSSTFWLSLSPRQRIYLSAT